MGVGRSGFYGIKVYQESLVMYDRNCLFIQGSDSGWVEGVTAVSSMSLLRFQPKHVSVWWSVRDSGTGDIGRI